MMTGLDCQVCGDPMAPAIGAVECEGCGAEYSVTATCAWFARCDAEATGTRRGPVGDGAFGELPVCDRHAGSGQYGSLSNPYREERFGDE